VQGHTNGVDRGEIRSDGLGERSPGGLQLAGDPPPRSTGWTDGMGGLVEQYGRRPGLFGGLIGRGEQRADDLLYQLAAVLHRPVTADIPGQRLEPPGRRGQLSGEAVEVGPQTVALPEMLALVAAEHRRERLPVELQGGSHAVDQLPVQHRPPRAMAPVKTRIGARRPDPVGAILQQDVLDLGAARALHDASAGSRALVTGSSSPAVGLSAQSSAKSATASQPGSPQV
jgi:hypothetical protein